MKNSKIRELLQNKNLKVTTNRYNLLNKLDKYGSAMSYSTIQKQMSPIDRVTLYRTIEKLKEKGLIHKAYQENNEIYYAICDVKCNENHRCHEHVHFKCSECNTIQCEEVDSTFSFLLPKYKIHKVSINIEGLCDNCI